MAVQRNKADMRMSTSVKLRKRIIGRIFQNLFLSNSYYVAFAIMQHLCSHFVFEGCIACCNLVLCLSVSSDDDEKCDEATDHETVHLPNTEAEDSRRVARVKHKEHVVHWSAKTKNTLWSAEHL